MATIQFNIDDTTLQQATMVLSKQGLSISEAMQQWITAIATSNFLPVQLKQSNPNIQHKGHRPSPELAWRGAQFVGDAVEPAFTAAEWGELYSMNIR